MIEVVFIERFLLSQDACSLTLQFSGNQAAQSLTVSAPVIPLHMVATAPADSQAFVSSPICIPVMPSNQCIPAAGQTGSSHSIHYHHCLYHLHPLVFDHPQSVDN